MVIRKLRIHLKIYFNRFCLNSTANGFNSYNNNNNNYNNNDDDDDDDNDNKSSKFCNDAFSKFLILFPDCS